MTDRDVKPENMTPDELRSFLRRAWLDALKATRKDLALWRDAQRFDRFRDRIVLK